jgi:hypothetical protein
MLRAWGACIGARGRGPLERLFARKADFCNTGLLWRCVTAAATSYPDEAGEGFKMKSQTHTRIVRLHPAGMTGMATLAPAAGRRITHGHAPGSYTAAGATSFGTASSAPKLNVRRRSRGLIQRPPPLKDAADAG